MKSKHSIGLHNFDPKDGERGAKSRAYFMQYFSAKKDVPTITDDPKSDTPGRKNMDYPVRVNALKSCESINGWIAIPMVRCGICAVSTLRMCFMHAEYH